MSVGQGWRVPDADGGTGAGELLETGESLGYLLCAACLRFARFHTPRFFGVLLVELVSVRADTPLVSVRPTNLYSQSTPLPHLTYVLAHHGVRPRNPPRPQHQRGRQRPAWKDRQNRPHRHLRRKDRAHRCRCLGQTRLLVPHLAQMADPNRRLLHPDLHEHERVALRQRRRPHRRGARHL
jgi:hypothetical protein